MPNRGPVNRCAVRACPMLGYWPEGGMCRKHAEEYKPTPTWLDLVWDRDSTPGRGAPPGARADSPGLHDISHSTGRGISPDEGVG